MSFDAIKGDESKRRVTDSEAIHTRTMMPDDANPWGDVHGGVIMKIVDEAAGSAAMRHAHCRVATAALDYMSFLHPVHIGDLVTARASVNDVGRTSMEVGVRVESENLLTGEIHHTSSAYVVMVALDDAGRPMAVPQVIPETPDQKRRMAAAKIRRSQRKILVAALEQNDQAAHRAVASDLVGSSADRTP